MTTSLSYCEEGSTVLIVVRVSHLWWISRPMCVVARLLLVLLVSMRAFQRFFFVLDGFRKEKRWRSGGREGKEGEGGGGCER